jgi:hypothetical protein
LLNKPITNLNGVFSGKTRYSINGTGILKQPEGCDFFIEQITLPASRHFKSKADWDGPGINVPQSPDLLIPEEVLYLQQYQALLKDIWDTWDDPTGGTNSDTAPRTMTLLQQQMETRLHVRRWIYGGIVTGSTAAAAIIGLCLWRHRRTLHSLRKRYGTKGTVPAEDGTDNKIHRGEGPEERQDNEMVQDEDQREQNRRAPSKTIVFQ